MPRVLVVDDDPGIREVVALELRTAGLEADKASDGRAALKMLCQQTVDRRLYSVVILDIVMPGIDGWQVLKAIKNNPLWESMKVIVLTGQVDSADGLRRIIEYDGVYVEKRAGFGQTVCELVARVLNE